MSAEMSWVTLQRQSVSQSLLASSSSVTLNQILAEVRQLRGSCHGASSLKGERVYLLYSTLYWSLHNLSALATVSRSDRPSWPWAPPILYPCVSCLLCPGCVLFYLCVCLSYVTSLDVCGSVVILNKEPIGARWRNMPLTAILSRWIVGTLVVLMHQTCIHIGEDRCRYQHHMPCSTI
jgi:hypothetical protein